MAKFPKDILDKFKNTGAFPFHEFEKGLKMLSNHYKKKENNLERAMLIKRKKQ